MGQLTGQKEDFRDSLGIINKEGKRKWIYPKKPSGFFYTLRNIFSLLLFGIFFGIPFVKLNGHPFVLFNVLERNFILFGIPFGPHDFHLFVIAMIAIVVFIILFTVVFGRVFCGWACPQTVFMEMIFRKIEFFIEGNANKQKLLNLASLSTEKFFKKGIKHLTFLIISFIISNFFLSYIIGMESLIKIIKDSPSEHSAGLSAIMIFSGIFYWVFAFFREQACILVCPYGRLQGVLLDRDSIVIAYDDFRGEPRGKIRRNETLDKTGDCIDCSLCVEVCPTGIDIRNGLQLECVNCTACIDACNSIMDKVNRPRGLIRYTSINGIERNTSFRFTPRILSYSAVIIFLLAVLGLLLNSRTDFDINVFRTPGLLYQEQSNHRVSNLYDLNIVNKTYNKMMVTLKLKNIKGEIKLIGNTLEIKPQGIADAKFMVILANEEINMMNVPLIIGIYSNNTLISEIKSSFLGPAHKGEDKK